MVRGPIVNSYNYRMFYFPGEELPLFTEPLNTHMQIYDLMISQLAMMCQIECQKFYRPGPNDLFICQYKNLKDRI